MEPDRMHGQKRVKNRHIYGRVTMAGIHMYHKHQNAKRSVKIRRCSYKCVKECAVRLLGVDYTNWARQNIAHCPHIVAIGLTLW